MVPSGPSFVSLARRSQPRYSQFWSVHPTRLCCLLTLVCLAFTEALRTRSSRLRCFGDAKEERRCRCQQSVESTKSQMCPARQRIISTLWAASTASVGAMASPKPVHSPRMLVVLLLGLLVTFQGCSAKVARTNGDPLLVGSQVRIRVLVERDSYFGVVACGEVQCGGVRIDGVESRGMGYRTFLSNATNRPFRATWVVKEDYPYITAFVPGKEYTFVVARPAEQKMEVWLEGKEERVAQINLSPGVSELHVAFKNGDYRFIGDDFESSGALRRALCTGTKVGHQATSLKETGSDIVEIKTGCRYESDDKVQAMCVIFLVVEGVKGRQEVYRATLGRENYDPEQEETLQLPFRFEEKQYLIFEVYRGYSDCDIPDRDDLLGTVQTPLATVNTKGIVEVAVKQPNGDKYSARFQRNCDERLTLQFSGRSLEGNGDVFLEIIKTAVKKVKRDIDLLIWDEMSVSVNALCDGDYNRTIRVNALQTDEEGTTLIGSFNTTLNELKTPNATYELFNHAKQSLKHSGEIRVGEIPQIPTFSQYVAVGFELLGTVQIDFTGSNNAPVPSLHNIGEEPNKYELAIKGVCSVVENFIANRIFKAYGFGVNFHGTVSHDFNLNLDSGSPDCVGVEGILETYHKSLRKLDGLMSGPTYFAPGLSKVIAMARQFTDGSKYFVHLLLTDGNLHDLKETKQAILEASGLPISIIMIGIGDADFSTVRTLLTDVEGGEAKTGTIWNKGERAVRDIVQFVPIREFQGTNLDAEGKLRRHVLSKIPPQYLEYMKIKKIPPKPPRNSKIERYCA
ncbi:copine-9-like isoform X2 [Thrips palmi]|uniref:Copine-9-like isoform X2 n=1 Tax=Thrips palmi TaxID=161013 RepID=A0A6P8Y6F8_THRPL|nr:copine-9-like isoform X2 [Thrips palmi]